MGLYIPAGRSIAAQGLSTGKQGPGSEALSLTNNASRISSQVYFMCYITTGKYIPCVTYFTCSVQSGHGQPLQKKKKKSVAFKLTNYDQSGLINSASKVGVADIPRVLSVLIHPCHSLVLLQYLCMSVPSKARLTFDYPLNPALAATEIQSLIFKAG